MEMQSTITTLNSKRSRSFNDLAQRSLGLNILKTETIRQVTIAYLKLLDNQDRHKLSDEFEIWLFCTFHLGVTCPVVLKLYLTLSLYIAVLTF